jgi:hypothetical protein
VILGAIYVRHQMLYASAEGRIRSLTDIAKSREFLFNA